MDDAAKREFQAVYRHPERMLVFLPLALLCLAAGVAWLFSPGGTDDLGLVIGLIAGLPVALMAFGVFNAVRGCDWVLTDDGLRIHEWPRFILTGFSRRRVVPYGEITGLHRLETSLGDGGLELTTRDGRRFYMPRAFGPWSAVPRRRAIPEERRETDLDRFIETIRATAARHGNATIGVAEGLDFWSGLPGIAAQVVLLGIALALAGLVVWALLDGFTGNHPGRSGYAMGILLVLPFGAGYMLRRSLRRRRRVLTGT